MTEESHVEFNKSQEKKHDDMANHHLKMREVLSKVKNKDLDRSVVIKTHNTNRDSAMKSHLDASNAHRKAARHYGAYVTGDYSGANAQYIDKLPHSSSKDARVASDEAHKSSKKFDDNFYTKHTPGNYRNWYSEI